MLVHAWGQLSSTSLGSIEAAEFRRQTTLKCCAFLIVLHSMRGYLYFLRTRTTRETSDRIRELSALRARVDTVTVRAVLPCVANSWW